MFPAERRMAEPDFSYSDPSQLPWSQIETVLLDMDGTLLDRHFDDFFWEERVPERFALMKKIPLSEAKKKLSAVFKAQERTLNWTDIYYWSARLELDIVALKEEMQTEVRVHSGVEAFLEKLQKQHKKVVLVTNAHPKTVQIKLEQTSLLPFFETILCSSDVGMPKEELGFWREAERVLGFDRLKTLFVDDNEAVLLAAHAFGIRYILHKTGASTQIPNPASQHFTTLKDFRALRI